MAADVAGAGRAAVPRTPPLSGAIPTGLGSLSSLTELDLVTNDLSGAIPTQLGSLTNLTTLRLSGAGLSGAIPTQLGSLTTLHIDGGDLTGAIPTQLGGLTSLTTLHIGGGSLTGAIPTQLSSLTALTSLYISGSGLSGTLPPELGALTSLETLWIKSDSLTGTVPARYGGLTSLDTLYLSGGALTGPVPAWLSSLASLERLYLHNNALTGPVPADLADLTTVWLSGNDLRGHIPPQTANAAALATLDVRDNPLSWPAPANLTDPPARLTALLPDTDSWVPPRPGNVTADAADASVTVTWDHPGAGDHFLVDTYTINYRPADHTGDHTQLAAAESPAAITGLTNATEYAIFVTATNTGGTSNPSLTVAATPSTTAQARTHDHTGAYSDSDDIAASAHEDAINALAGWHIFDRTDCSMNPLKFCPDSALPRWKLAVWLVRAPDRRTAAPTGTGDTFSDVTKWYKPFVERLRVLGVTTGCVRRSTIFCPNDTVTRAEMAVFLVRAFNIPLAGDAGFTDIDRGYWAYDQINAIADAGITRGCTSTAFCPEANTTNAQMAAFIHRACTNTNRDCSPTDIENGSTGGGGGTTPQPQGPSAPTITNITAGPGTLTVTWQRHDDDADRTITKWQIQPHKLTYTTNNLGVTIDTATALDPLDAPGGTRTQQTHTIENLEFNTAYRIEVRGYYGTTAGTYSTPETATTNPAAVRLVGLEVTQGLQSWQGDITLVAGKRTVVRAFFETVSDSVYAAVAVPKPVRAELYAMRGDGVALGPVKALNPRQTIWAGPNVEARRDSLAASLNFVLYAGSMNTGSDIESYRLNFIGDRADCQESRPPARTCEASNFVEVDTPRVALIPLAINGDRPTDADLHEQAERIRSLMPVPSLDYRILDLELDFDFRPPPFAVNRSLFSERNWKNDTEIYLGVMPGANPQGMNAGRAGSIPGVVANWYMNRRLGETANDNTQARDTLNYGRNAGAHEFAHTIGGYHAAYWDGDGYSTVCSPDTGAGAIGDVTEYPYQEPAVSGGSVRALLWAPPVSAEPDVGDMAVWGLDTRFVTSHGLNTLLTSGERDELAVLDPAKVYSVMSGCVDHNGGVEFRWIDAYHHPLFITAIDGIDWSLGPQPADGSLWEMFSGTWSPTPGGGPGQVVVAPTVRLRPTTMPSEPVEGDYLLELLDSAGAVVRSVSFPGSAGAAVNTAQGSFAPASEIWAVPVKDPPDYASYRIRQQSQTLVAVQRSASAPVVTVNSPTADQSVASDIVEFSWTASDPDGDELSFTVQYSTDAGANYETIAAEHDSTTLRLARSRLAGSTRSRIRVIASDGARSTTAESAVFAVATNAPEVFIRSPLAATTLAGAATLALDAAAFDPEDGRLPASSIAWSSSIAGPLGTGATVTVDTTSLAEGTHTLTATATDSSSTAGSASVTVTIRRQDTAPTAADDIAVATTGAATTVDVLANDSDPDGDIDGSSTMAIVAPAAGDVQIARGGDTGRVIRYMPAGRGYDTLIYRVCDTSGQCATAELTVAVLDDA